MSIQQFARGRVTYGSGSYAPTRGQVSAKGAQGYLKRELRKNTKQGVSSYGGDGASDTRSGVASAALARKNKGGLNSWDRQGWGPKPPQTGGPRPIRELPDESGLGLGFTTGGPRPVRETPDESGLGQGMNGGTPEQPNVTIGANGQLQLPYNANWGQTVLGALGDYNSQLLDIQGQRQQQALDFMNQNKQADDQYTTLKRDTLSNSAGAGTAFSSGYGLAVGNNANAYNTFKNNLATQNSMANSQFDLQQSGIVANFNDILRQGALDLADETAQNAGSLGFGTTTPPSGGGGGGKNNGGKPTTGGPRPWLPPTSDAPIQGGGSTTIVKGTPTAAARTSKSKHQNAAKAKMKRGRNAK